MKAARNALLGLAALAVCLAALAAAAFNGRVQNWAARKWLAAHPRWGVSVGSVAATLDEVRVQGLRIETNGVVFSAPSADAEMPPLAAGLGHRVAIRRLSASGWVLDLTGEKSGAFRSGFLVGDAFGLAAVRLFQAMRGGAALPVDLSIDDLQLEGDVLLPPPAGGGTAPVRAHVVLNGGGLAAGNEGRFTFTVSAAVSNPASAVDALSVDGVLIASMPDPRTIDRVAARINAAAKGPEFPRGVRLSADVGAVRGKDGENFTVTLAGESKQLVTVSADLPAGSNRISGGWKLDVCDADVSPFTLGRPLPLFDAVGEGRFDAEVGGAGIHVSGDLNATFDRLGVLRPELAVAGAVRLSADFDLTHRGSLLRVDRLQAELSGAQPILSVRSLQPFAFNASTGELQVADAARDLLGISLQALPTGWLKPFATAWLIEGAPIRGELAASAQAGGVAVHTTEPLETDGLALSRSGRPLLRDVDASVSVSASDSPEGWQVEIAARASDLASRFDAEGRPRSPLITLSAKCGRLAGGGQPLKIAGRLGANLPSLLAQPALAGRGSGIPLVDGEFSCDFTGSLAGRTSLEATIDLRDMEADPTVSAAALPAATVELRADVDPAGRIEINAPVALDGGGRHSDFTLQGWLAGAGDGFAFDGDLASGRLAFEDVEALAAVLSGTGRARAGGAGTAPAPFWAGARGRVSLAVKKLDFGAWAAAGVTGALDFRGDALRFDGLKGTVGAAGEARVDGAITFSGAAAAPYRLQAEVTLVNCDPGQFLKGPEGDEAPAIEGQFNVDANVAGAGRTLADLASGLHGECAVTSRGGVLRLLATDIAPKPKRLGKPAVIGELIGKMANAVTDAVTRRKGPAEFANKAQALMELAGSVAAIHYDQLSFTLSGGGGSDAELKDFALISPEIRLGGSGRVSCDAGTPLVSGPLALDFQLRARGRTADALKYLGALDPKADDLGYCACTLPLQIGGSLAKPDTSQLQTALLKIAL